MKKVNITLIVLISLIVLVLIGGIFVVGGKSLSIIKDTVTLPIPEDAVTADFKVTVVNTGNMDGYFTLSGFTIGDVSYDISSYEERLVLRGQSYSWLLTGLDLTPITSGLVTITASVESRNGYTGDVMTKTLTKESIRASCTVISRMDGATALTSSFIAFNSDDDAELECYTPSTSSLIGMNVFHCMDKLRAPDGYSIFSYSSSTDGFNWYLVKDCAETGHTTTAVKLIPTTCPANAEVPYNLGGTYKEKYAPKTKKCVVNFRTNMPTPGALALFGAGQPNDRANWIAIDTNADGLLECYGGTGEVTSSSYTPFPPDIPAVNNQFILGYIWGVDPDAFWDGPAVWMGWPRGAKYNFKAGGYGTAATAACEAVAGVHSTTYLGTAGITEMCWGICS
jgi:hypothetical protein